MIIDSLNGDVINSSKISIHDYIFVGFNLDYKDNCLYIKITSPDMGAKIKIIKFKNVIGFDFVSCDFWGKSPHIFDWKFIDPNEQSLIPKLKKEKKDNQYWLSRLDDYKKFIESVITLTSGDRLTIACELIIF